MGAFKKHFHFISLQTLLGRYIFECSLNVLISSNISKTSAECPNKMFHERCINIRAVNRLKNLIAINRMIAMS